MFIFKRSHIRVDQKFIEIAEQIKKITLFVLKKFLLFIKLYFA